ncbi:MAG: VWA domain-containing protein, partial [Candidatus Promineifilaceae bacterium]|nr:VWA domain-containing protein [Candidatus Promineifilaceae bacterium]
VMADLLVDGDRVLVMDFSAHSCSGDDCTFDINTYLTRSEIPTGATIGDVHDAIDMVSARDRTPIGEALVRAKDALLASPAGENPKSIVLLSDGEQNVNPKYADVRTEIVDSGVIVNTVGLSSEADEGLMAQIAGDTGGTYRFVPTTPGTLGPAQAAPEAVAAELEALGVAPEMAESIAATTAYLPGPLRIDEVYDQFETEAQDASRIMQTNDANLALNTWRESFANVDESATMLRLVVGAQHPDMGSGCQQLDRRTEVLPPGADPEEGWIPVNPPRNVPAGWDVRHSTFDDVVIIPAPEAGEWGLRTLYRYGLCAATAGEIPEAIAQSSYPVMLNASIQTPYKLEGYFPQGAIQKAGNKVHVVGALMDANGTIPGAAFGSCPGLIGVVERPGGAVQFFCLPDDGGNLDGGPDDGLYGGSYAITDIGGSYTLSLFAIFEDPAQPGQQLVRQWKSTFWIDGPEEQDPDRGDADGDGMPDVWEIRCGLDPKVNDAQGDLDEDWLSNAEELRRGTLPCDPDTDDGGETDGSEVEFGRNPLWPDDDDVPKLGYVSVQPRPGQIRVYWANPPGITSVNITLVNGQSQTFLAKPTGEYFIPNVQNGTGYTVTLSLENNGAVGPPSPPQSVVPREDYVRPQGSVLINQDARATHSRHVTLNIDALDSFEQGPYALLAPEARAALLGPRHGEEGAATGVAEMRIAEDPAAFHDEEAGWREFQRDVRWELRRCSVGETCAVYVQFRDEAGNLSIIVSDEILLERLRLLLPVIQR